VRINAHGTPTDAHGHISFDIPGTPFADVKATVTCLNVVGNTATLSGPIKNPDPDGPLYIRVGVTDNAPPGRKPQTESTRSYPRNPIETAQSP